MNSITAYIDPRVSKLHRWEVLVEIEGQRIEFVAPRVGLERPEPVPPMHSPVLPRRIVFLMQRDV